MDGHWTSLSDSSELAPDLPAAKPPVIKSPSAMLAVAALACVLAAGLTLGIDVPVARFCMLLKLPGDIHAILGVSELFAHGAGVIFLGLAIAVLDTRGRRRATRAVSAAFAAGFVALVAKCLIGRWRPKRFHFEGDVWDTFTGWIPAWTNADVSEIANHGLQSMPSGHSATAVALACILAYTYPRGRWLFPSFAVMVMLQRISEGAHFVSDTFVAAAIGLLTGIVFLDDRLLGRHFRDAAGSDSVVQPSVDLPPTSDLHPSIRVYSGRMSSREFAERSDRSQQQPVQRLPESSIEEPS